MMREKWFVKIGAWFLALAPTKLDERVSPQVALGKGEALVVHQEVEIAHSEAHAVQA